jgi:hypothetical protein
MINANEMLIRKVEENRLLQSQDIDGRTTLIYVKQQGVWVWALFDWSKIGFRDEHSYPINVEVFLNHENLRKHHNFTELFYSLSPMMFKRWK